MLLTWTRSLGLDSETYPIRPGRQAPRVVCGQTREGGIELREAYLDRLERWLKDPTVRLFGHNIAYDLLCAIATRPRLMPLVLAAYAADRITCTYEREKLIRIAMGTLPRYPKNGLIDLCRRYKIETGHLDGDKGPNGVRCAYWTQDGIPVDQWPEDFRRYALADLVVDDVFLAQEQAPEVWLRDQYRQARAAFWLGLDSAWGMRVDPRAVASFGALLEAEHVDVKALLTTGAPAALLAFCNAQNAAHPDAKPMDPSWSPLPFSGGFVRSVGSKDTKLAAARMRAVCRAKGLPVPLTDTGKEHLAEGGDRDTLAEKYTSLTAAATAATGDPVLIAYSRFVSIGILRSRVERLRLAAEYGIPIQPRFDALKETGRISCSGGEQKPGKALLAFGDQTQNPHRAPGLRECYMARPGHLIGSSDWTAAELHGLAQGTIDLGLDSNLARVLNSGQDVHLWFACQVQGWAYAWAKAALKGEHGPDALKAVKRARQEAKPAMFGFPGGLGTEKFRMFAAATYQVLFSDAEAKNLKGLWLDAFPEMVGYFAHINDLCASGEPQIFFRSGRYRGEVRYTSAANGYFQGRIADMLKCAGWNLTEEIYLRGLPARTWNNAHDEILTEHPEEHAAAGVARVVEIMEEAGRLWCPDCPPKAVGALQRSWRKAAEPAFRNGILIPYEDRDLDDATVAKVRKALASGADPIHTSWTFGLTEDRTRSLAA